MRRELVESVPCPAGIAKVPMTAAQILTPLTPHKARPRAVCQRSPASPGRFRVPQAASILTVVLGLEVRKRFIKHGRNKRATSSLLNYLFVARLYPSSCACQFKIFYEGKKHKVIVYHLISTGYILDYIMSNGPMKSADNSAWTLNCYDAKVSVAYRGAQPAVETCST